MERIIRIGILACVCLALVGCSGESSQEEEVPLDTEPSHAIALSMTHARSLGGLTYVVAGDWTEEANEEQATYTTGYSTFILSFTKGEDTQGLASRMINAAGFNADAFSFNNDLDQAESQREATEEEISVSEDEEIEVNGVLGTKRSATVDGSPAEVYTFFVDDTQYCVLVVYGEVSDQDKAYEATDTLIASLSFTEVQGSGQEHSEEVKAS